MTPDEYANSSIRVLIEHVFENRNGLMNGLPYSELSARIGRTNRRGRGNPRGMGPILDKIGAILQGLSDSWGEPVPKLQSMVVNKTGKEKNLPSDGMEVFWPGYQELSLNEKKNKTQAEFKKITDFGSRWNNVLRGLGLSEVTAQRGKKASKQGGSKGGESEAHKTLKEFVRDNPNLVDAASDSDGFVEYALPTLDVIDVLFKSKNAWVAVEVKSEVSDRCPVDYERGLYQTIKYGALLRAMKKCDGTIPLSIRSVLVVQSILPPEYCILARRLGIQFYENVSASKD